MEENTKKKIEFTVAGITMSLVTDESDAFVGAVVKSIDEMEKSDLATVRFEEFNEQYQYLVAAALVLLVLDVFILSRRNPRLRRFNIFREHRSGEEL